MPVINDGKKQTLYSGPQPNQSFVAVMTTAERTSGKSTKGTMIYDTDDEALYIYTGTAWVIISID